MLRQDVNNIGGFAEDDPRERIILNWAKEHYKGYTSINTFPFHQYDMKPKITAGVVYLCLKKHSFIQQNETTEYRVMDAYFRFNGNLLFMCEDLGLGVWIVAKTVEKLGYPPRWHEYRESRYITRSSSGTSAEMKFKQLVPDAVDMNENYRENNPIFDFIVNEKTVDVKELTAISRKYNKQQYYDFKFPKNEEERADFYCLFLCHDKQARMKGSFDVLLIPQEALPMNKGQTQISVSETANSHKFFYQFQVDPTSLAYMLGCEP
ncbi:hypothetical protein [Rodentibacter trehalosifermentans]|uniref:hypothetical protein n=1 Tax=Rodentibacter trehalosifermentans TaxID=1908263 RepID=UPI0009858D82|nr:hypothetical protein [Rodentibacter trehalosifermentans]OOF52742.1 hypothetical protein BKK53_03875 [Rodentibacter trehalosifermentans]